MHWEWVPASQHLLWQSALTHCTLALQLAPSAFLGAQLAEET